MRTEMRAAATALKKASASFGDNNDSFAVELIGVGPERASSGTKAILSRYPDVERVVVAGVSGGLEPDVAVGCLFVPETVREFETDHEVHPAPLSKKAEGTLATCHELITDKERLSRALGEGVHAVDMESYAVGVICEERNLPYSIIRSISDHQDGELVDDRVMGLLKPDGGVNFGALVKLLARQPSAVRYLAEINKGFRQALHIMASATVDECRAFFAV
jgi:nucleoside phosphorylase